MARPQRKVYNLVFDDLDGLTVKVKSISIGQLRKFMAFKDGGSTVEQTEEMLTTFADALESWDLETEDGQPVPATAEGIDSEDRDLILQIINAWVDTLSGVDEELGKGSPSGSTFPEASIPMEPLSPSLAS